MKCVLKIQARVLQTDWIKTIENRLVIKAKKLLKSHFKNLSWLVIKALVFPNINHSTQAASVVVY